MINGTLLALLLGAGLTFTAQAVLQLAIVPRVETRKRREDRWEKNVLELGELLSKELPRAARHTESKQNLFQWLNNAARGIEGINLDRLEAALPGHETTAVEATREFNELVHIQGTWLTDRISAIAPEARVITRFQIAWNMYRVATFLCMKYDKKEINYTEEEFQNDWSENRKRLDTLNEIVRELSLIRHPPQPSLVYGLRTRKHAALSIAKRFGRLVRDKLGKGRP